MIIDKNKNKYVDVSFFDIEKFLGENDVLVFNETEVIKSRLEGEITLVNGNKKRVEIFMLTNLENNTWECAVFPGERLKKGREINFYNQKNKIVLKGLIKETTYSGRIIEFNTFGEDMYKIINNIGAIPLPPYIKDKNQDISRYNTVYSKTKGSSAAPTAGLHFTKELIDRLQNKGVKIVKITLHVGLGTFKPITSDNPKDHKMHEEYIEISKESADMLNKYKKEGKNIIAVGTTVTRTLESFAGNNGEILYGNKKTDIFIYPGYKFKFINSLITNFHLPRTSLLMLVSAFYNREKILDAYAYAQKNKYRFYSFGDAMWIK